MTPCFTALLRRKGSDLLTLQQLFMSDGKSALFQELLPLLHPQQRRFLSGEWDKKRYETTKDAVVAKIQTLMNSEHFLNFLCGPSTLDLDRIVKERKVLCFSLQKGAIDRDTVTAIGLFVMASLQAYVQRHHQEREQDPNRIPIHAFVDECHNFLSPTVNSILEEARKFGLHLTLAQQYAGQKMDTELSKTVLGNTGVKLAGFNNEKATQREMARVMELDEGDLIGLEKRRFYVKSGDRAAVKLIPPSHLVDRRNCVSQADWQAELEKQKERYYRRIEEVATIDTTEEPEAPARALPPKPKLDFV